MLLSCTETIAPPEDRVASQFDENAFNVGYLHSPRQPVKNAAALASLHINANGGVLGKNFNLIFNVISDLDVALDNSLVMMDDYGIQALALSWSSLSLAVLEEAKPRKVVLIADTATSPLLSNADDNDLLFRTAPSDIHQGKVIAKLAREKGASKSVFVYVKDDVYGESLAEEFEKEFILLGGNSLGKIAIPKDVEVGFEDYISQTYALSPDVIIMGLLPTTANSSFINETLNQNYDGLYLLPDASINSVFVDNLADPRMLKNAFGVSPSTGYNQSKQQQFFAQNYLDAFGEEIDIYSANTYDAVMVLALAIEHAGGVNNSTSPTGTMISQSMREVMNPEGVEVGPLNIDEAFSLVRSNQMINYNGAYSNNDFDVNGDIAGILAYDIYSFNNQMSAFDLIEQVIIEIPLPPKK